MNDPLDFEGPLSYLSKHLGPKEADVRLMLQTLGLSSLDQLIDQVVPRAIRSSGLNLEDAYSEDEYLDWIQVQAKKNRLCRSFLGQGFYDTHTPSVIRRMILENPGWYTQYTPYQPEISQGRLEALLNYQTMVVDLTGLEIANASLLDEASAGAEAMQMAHRLFHKTDLPPRAKFLVVGAFSTTLDVLQTRAEPLNIELVIEQELPKTVPEGIFGALVQVPNYQGKIFSLAGFIEQVHAQNAYAIVGSDLMYCAIFKPAGEEGADIVYGSSQRFGVPMGFGGPSAAFFATRKDFIREVPGRVIGVSVDKYNRTAYRMTLQTREQHIKREKATSNICTAQALLAIMAGFYAVYHGPAGIQKIATTIHQKTRFLAEHLEKAGYQLLHQAYFDTIFIRFADADKKKAILKHCKLQQINLQDVDDCLGISLDERTSYQDLQGIFSCFLLPVPDFPPAWEGKVTTSVPSRQTPYLTHPVFQSYQSETEMMRYIKNLESKDVSLCNSMIPLGSCTMKLNAASAMLPITLPAFNLHPFVPPEQALGYKEVLCCLEKVLKEITGFAGVSLQPNSGAQGEYAGLLVIRKYFQSKHQPRDVVFIPSSAHGTNPASAIMSGMEVVVIQCNQNGEVDLADLQQKASLHKDRLACLMITYPSTHGIYEERILELTETIHQHGGLVYMDGANMNAQVGLTSPALIGADVCHLNLHKTFSIPHGGGGPGVGPILVRDFLIPFLPSHRFLEPKDRKQPFWALTAAPFGSASILLISLAYSMMLGKKGLKTASEIAILNANYILARVKDKIPPLYLNSKGRVAHELILDARGFKSLGIEVSDLAKRLIDYGFHPPTVSFPVAGTLMIEPTESESKEELDRFCDALIGIYGEIEKIQQGTYSKDNNPLKNAPHSLFDLTAETWDHPYSKEQAVFPDPFLKTRKVFAAVNRINDVFGDRQLFCTCPLPADFATP